MVLINQISRLYLILPEHVDKLYLAPPLSHQEQIRPGKTMADTVCSVVPVLFETISLTTFSYICPPSRIYSVAAVVSKSRIKEPYTLPLLALCLLPNPSISGSSPIITRSGIDIFVLRRENTAMDVRYKLSEYSSRYNCGTRDPETCIDRQARIRSLNTSYQRILSYESTPHQREVPEDC